MRSDMQVPARANGPGVEKTLHPCNKASSREGLDAIPRAARGYLLFDKQRGPCLTIPSTVLAAALASDLPIPGIASPRLSAASQHARAVLLFCHCFWFPGKRGEFPAHRSDGFETAPVQLGRLLDNLAVFARPSVLSTDWPPPCQATSLSRRHLWRGMSQSATLVQGAPAGL